jgi:hypothetical protein
MFIADRPESMLWIEALLARTRHRSIDPWTLGRVADLLAREGWRARARG